MASVTEEDIFVNTTLFLMFFHWTALDPICMTGALLCPPLESFFTRSEFCDLS